MAGKEEVIGHTEKREKLASLVKKGVLSHAVLLAGQPGIGKSLVAGELARQILCLSDNKTQGGCGKCHSCRAASSGNHPDLFQLQCSEGIKVDELRILLEEIAVRPAIGSKRVVLMNDADQLSISACNLLLKTLEEPPPAITFLLVAGNVARLPRTVRSRCQVWFFDQLKKKDLLEIYASRAASVSGNLKLSEKDLLELADGSLAEIDSVESWYDTWKLTRLSLKKIAGGDLGEALSLANTRAKDKSSLPLFFKCCRITGRAGIMQAEHPLQKRKWAVFLSNIIEGESLISERNVSSLAVLSSILIQLARNTPGKARSIGLYKVEW